MTGVMRTTAGPEPRARDAYRVTQAPPCALLSTARAIKRMPITPSSTLAYLEPSHENGFPSR